jgi:hypothetical protein
VKLDRLRWAAFPLGLFLATRLALFGLAAAGTVVGSVEGGDAGMRARFRASFATMAAVAHGDASQYARIAREGYRTPEDGRFFPLLVGVGKVAAALGQVVETWMLVVSLLAGAGAFVVVHRFFERTVDREAAGWGLALLAASPFAFHLSDGGALSLATFLSAAAALLSLEGRAIPAGVVAAVGALAHPAALAVAPLLAWPGPAAREQRMASRLIAGALPLLACAGWLVYLRVPPGALGADPLAAAGPALVVSLLFAGVVAAGCVLLALTRGHPGLAVAAGLQLVLLLALAGAPAGRSLAASWLAFLPLGRLVARRPALSAPAVAVLALYQGLLFYLHSHYYGPL